MNEKQLAALLKAANKPLTDHYTKSAAFEKSMADDDDKCMMAHKAHAEHYDGLGKADDAQKEHYKANAAYHKTMAGIHEGVSKRRKERSEDYAKLAKAYSEDDAEKVFKSLGIITEGELAKMSTTATPTTTVTPTPVVATPATPVTPVTPTPSADFNDTITKALESKLNTAIESAFERVLNSDDFNKKVDQAISGKMLEKLGTAASPGEIRTTSVARPGGTTVAPVTKVDTTGIDPELLDLCKME